MQSTMPPQVNCLKNSNILKFEDLYTMLISQLVFKVVKGTVPVPLQSIILKKRDVQIRDMRNKDNLVKKKHKNHIVEDSYLVTGPKVWNTVCNLRSLSC